MIFSFAHFYYYYSGHQLLAPLLQQLPVQSQLLRHQGGQVHGILPDGGRSGLHAGDGQHLADQALHPAGCLERAEQVLVPVPVHVHPLQHTGELAF